MTSQSIRRQASVTKALERLLAREAELSAREVSVPPDEDPVLIAFWELMAQIDEDGLISSKYVREPAVNDPDSLREQSIEACARFLLALNLSLDDGPLSRGSAAVAGYCINRLIGSRPKDPFPKRTGRGNRPRSIEQNGAFLMVARLVYFYAGLMDIGLQDAFAYLVPRRSWASFKRMRAKYIDLAECNIARNAGKLVSSGKPIPHDMLDMVSKCEHFLSDRSAQTDLVETAYRKDGT